MPEPQSRSITLARRPDGEPSPADFAVTEREIPGIGDRELLIRTELVALAPIQRQRMHTARSFVAPYEIGDVISSDLVGEVIESRDPEFAVGDRVAGRFAWQEHVATKGETLTRIDTDLAPASAWLNALGSSGLAAYFGMVDIGRVRPGDTVVVTSAAGAVGSLAGQLARLAGARVIGLVGSESKRELITSSFGFDTAMLRSADDLAEQLGEACPNGVNVFFDTVGGPVADVVHAHLAPRARVVMAGRTASVNSQSMEQDMADLRYIWVREASINALSVYSYVARFPEARQRMAQLLASGDLIQQETIVDGFDQTVPAFIGFLTGQYTGKMLVRYS